MSYEKTTWQNGDTITAEKLNKIENGIKDSAASVVVTHITIDVTVQGNQSVVGDMDYINLAASIESGKMVFLHCKGVFGDNVLIYDKVLLHMNAGRIIGQTAYNNYSLSSDDGSTWFISPKTT